MPEPLLWLADSRGIYIPRDFATSFADRAKSVSGVPDEDWATLEAGPDDEWYWDAWTTVCSDAVVTDEHGNKFFIYQDGDCWLIPEGMEWSDETEFFEWPKKTLDQAQEAFEHAPSKETACALRVIAREYCDDGMIGYQELFDIIASTAGWAEDERSDR